MKNKLQNKRLYNLNHFVIGVSTLLVSVLSVFAYSHIDNYIKEKNYNECYKQYEGANFISCDTNEYFVYRSEEAVVIVPVKATTSLKTTLKSKVIKNNDIDVVLDKYFGNEAYIVKAILTHESNLKVNAISYNCYYKNGVIYAERVKGVKSTFCKSGHEQYAWSIDCGVAMLNYHGKVCPSYTMELEPSIIKMKSMVDKRGYQPWVSFNTGAYKQYLTLN